MRLAQRALTAPEGPGRVPGRAVEGAWETAHSGSGGTGKGYITGTGAGPGHQGIRTHGGGVCTRRPPLGEPVPGVGEGGPAVTGSGLLQESFSQAKALCGLSDMPTGLPCDLARMQTPGGQLPQEVTDRFWINSGTKLEMCVEATHGDVIARHKETFQHPAGEGLAVPNGSSWRSLEPPECRRPSRHCWG